MSKRTRRPAVARAKGKYVVLDIDTHHEMNDSRAAHAIGVHRDPTTDEKLSDEKNKVFEDRRADYQLIVDSIKRRRGQEPIRVVELVTAGGPPFHSPEYKAAWNHDRDLAYHQESLDWIKNTFGPHIVVLWSAYHGDETSPHGHHAFLALDEDARGLRFSWSALLHKAAKTAPEPPKGSPGRGAYRYILESFAHHVGSKYGLQPGEKRKPGEIAPEVIDRVKAVEAREDRARQREERLNTWITEMTGENGRLVRGRNRLKGQIAELESEIAKLKSELAVLKSPAVRAAIERAQARLASLER